jgi:CHAD domain-containing protein
MILAQIRIIPGRFTVNEVGVSRGDSEGVHQMRIGIRRLRTVGRAEKAVASPRFRRLVLDAAAWIAIGDWTQNGDELNRLLRELPVVDAAAEELRRRSKKIRKQGSRLVELDARHRHKLRIRVKKLRYATEFFAGVFPSKNSMRRRNAMSPALGKHSWPAAFLDTRVLALHQP